MNSFAKAGILDPELFQKLELILIDQLELATGPQLISIFESHAEWSRHVINETVISKSQSKRVFKSFKNYNEEFFEIFLKTFLKIVDTECNLKGIFTLLKTGSICHLKKRSNMRLMREIALKGIMILRENGFEDK